MFAQNRYIIHRSILTGLSYVICDQDDHRLLYVDAQITGAGAMRFYSDEARSTPVMTLSRADTTFWSLDVASALRMADGHEVGRLRLMGLLSLIAPRVRISDPAGQPVAQGQMDSWFGLFTRRYLLAGQLGDRHDYAFSDGTRRIGWIDRDVSLGNRYLLDLSDDVQGVLDRRLAIATALMLAQGKW